MSLFFYILLGLGILALLWLLQQRLSFFIQNGWERFNYPFFQTGSEGLILSEAAIIRGGGSIYVPFQAGSFISAPYPPLYYYLIAAWPGNPANLFETGRVISVMAAALSAILITAIILTAARPASKREWFWPGLVAAICGLTFLTLPAVTVWAVRVRADMLMTALQLAGLALVALGTRRQKNWLIWLALLPFVLALFTKQTALAAPLAATIYLAFWYGRRWRQWLAWLTGLTLSTGLPFLLINFATGTELYRRLFKYHSLPWLSNNFWTYSNLFLSENAALLVMGTVLVIVTVGLSWSKWRETTESFSKWERVIEAGRAVPLVIWFCLAGLVSLLSLGVAGADHNHFLPVEAGGCLVAGWLGVRWLEMDRFRWLSLAALAGLGLQLAVSSVPVNRYEIEFRNHDQVYQAQLARIIKYAAARPGPLLSSEAGFLVLTGKTNPASDYYNDLFTLAALDRQGLYSEAGLLDRINHKDFGVILAEGDLFNQAGRADVWTPALVEALRRNYYLKFRDIWYTYEPLN